MNILTDRLPDRVAGYEIHTDYKRWILWETVIRDEDLTEAEKLTEMLLLVVKDPHSMKPEDIGNLFTALVKFHAGPVEWDKPDEEAQASTQEKSGTAEAYDLTIDQSLILAAFMQAYGINLSEASMHWWVFKSLLEGLPENTRFMTIVGYRTADTSKMPKKTAAEYAALKARYAIRRKKKPKTAEEAEAEMKRKVAALYAAAQKKKEERKNTKGGRSL